MRNSAQDSVIFNLKKKSILINHACQHMHLAKHVMWNYIQKDYTHFQFCFILLRWPYTWWSKPKGRRVASGEKCKKEKEDRSEKPTAGKVSPIYAFNHEFKGFGCVFMSIKSWIWSWWDGTVGKGWQSKFDSHNLYGGRRKPATTNCFRTPHTKCLRA